ncbi:SNF21_3 [Sanghuangporus weigelae]
MPSVSRTVATNGMMPFKASPLNKDASDGKWDQSVGESSGDDSSPTEEQVAALRAQIEAFKFIEQGAPIPEHIQRSMLPRNNAIANLEKSLYVPDIPVNRVNAAVQSTGTTLQQHASATPEAPELEDGSAEDAMWAGKLTMVKQQKDAPIPEHIQFEVQSGQVQYSGQGRTVFREEEEEEEEEQDEQDEIDGQQAVGTVTVQKHPCNVTRSTDSLVGPASVLFHLILMSYKIQDIWMKELTKFRAPKRDEPELLEAIWRLSCISGEQTLDLLLRGRVTVMLVFRCTVSLGGMRQLCLRQLQWQVEVHIWLETSSSGLGGTFDSALKNNTEQMKISETQLFLCFSR